MMQKCPKIGGFAVEINQFPNQAIAFLAEHGQKLGRNEAVRPNWVGSQVEKKRKNALGHLKGKASSAFKDSRCAL